MSLPNHPARRSLITQLATGPAEATPYFLISGAGGHVLPFQPTARRLADRRRGYGILHPGFVDPDANLKTVKAFAEWMLEDLLDAHPTGPYLLAGYSFGGLVALEMARLLIAEGCGVGLALIETRLSRLREKQPLAQRAKLRLGEACEPGFARKTAANLSNKISRRLRHVMRNSGGGSVGGASIRAQFDAVRSAADGAIRGYIPAPCPVPTVLIQAKTPDPHEHYYRPVADCGWGAVVDLIGSFETPGRHLDLFKGGREAAFAEALGSALDQLDAALGPSAHGAAETGAGS